MSKIFFYHKNCTDGFGSALAAYWHNPEKENLFLPFQHGEESSISSELLIPENKIYFLDVAPRKQFLDDLRSKNIEVVIIDHHKTALEEHGEHSDNHFDMKHSGAVLTWKHFSKSNEAIPSLYRYIEDKDLWKFELPDSKEINALLYETPKDFMSFLDFQNKLVSGQYNKLVEDGAKIIHAEKVYLNFAKKHACIGNFGGYEDVIVINTIPYMVSELLHYFVQEHPCAFAVAWYQQPDGKYKYSARVSDTSEVNVGVICREIAQSVNGIGGGHPKASGMILDTLVLPTNIRKL